MEEKKTIRIHRVGSITFGSVLVIFGILFLLHGLLPVFTYQLIFKLWPCILILLGVEVLLSSARGTTRFVYDKTAILLTIVLTFFTICLAFLDCALEHGGGWIQI